MATRTFIAVELGDEVRAALRREIARLARALPGVRWAAPESLHLTLAFLGALDDDQLAAATAAAEETAASASPFTLRIEGLGTFGPPHAPRVVWAGLGGDVRALTAVQRRLVRALEVRGFPPEERAFSPHLTLARLKDRLDADALQRLVSLVRSPAPAKAPLLVHSLAVMKSELHRSGAVYTRLRDCPFGGEAG